MFAKATTNLVSDIDPNGTLIPVLQLNNSDKLAPLALVIKRNRFWFWQKPLFLPTGFTLNDVLVKGQTVEAEVVESDFLKYKGTFGDKLDTSLETGMGVANVTLEGKGFAKLQSSFGSLRKQELNVRKLLRDSSDKHLDLQHVLLEQVRERRKHVLGVVRERVFTTQECSVCEETEETGTCSSIFKPLLPNRIKVSVKQSGTLEADSNVLLTIPANTTLAFSLIELEVKTAGQYELCLLQGIKGGFQVDSDNVEKNGMDVLTVLHREDVADAGENMTHTGSLLTDLEGVHGHLTLLARESAGTRTALLQQLSELMKSQEALDSLEQALEDLCGGVTPDLRSLDQDPHLKTQVMSFLRLLPQAGGGTTDPPQPPLLTSLHLLVSALDEMFDEGLSALSSCCSSPPVLQALQRLVLRLASEGVCSPVDPALAQEEVFQCVERLFAASGINLRREAGTLKSEGGVLTGHLPLVMSIAVSGLAALGESK